MAKMSVPHKEPDTDRDCWYQPVADSLCTKCGRTRLHDERDALADLVRTLWLYIGVYEESQLTSEQRELLFSLTTDEVV